MNRRRLALGTAIAALGIVLSTLGGAIVASAQQLPKLKQPGEITARASTGMPTADVARYSVTWATSLRFRDSSSTAAVCVVVKTHSCQNDGLHLTGPAARELAGQLTITSSAVEIDNHSHHHSNVWERFSAPDGRALAAALTRSAQGH